MCGEWPGMWSRRSRLLENSRGRLFHNPCPPLPTRIWAGGTGFPACAVPGPLSQSPFRTLHPALLCAAWFRLVSQALPGQSPLFSGDCGGVALWLRNKPWVRFSVFRSFLVPKLLLGNPSEEKAPAFSPLSLKPWLSEAGASPPMAFPSWSLGTRRMCGFRFLFSIGGHGGPPHLMIRQTAQARRLGCQEISRGGGSGPERAAKLAGE